VLGRSVTWLANFASTSGTVSSLNLESARILQKDIVNSCVPTLPQRLDRPWLIRFDRRFQLFIAYTLPVGWSTLRFELIVEKVVWCTLHVDERLLTLKSLIWLWSQQSVQKRISHRLGWTLEWAVWKSREKRISKSLTYTDSGVVREKSVLTLLSQAICPVHFCPEYDFCPEEKPSIKEKLCIYVIDFEIRTSKISHPVALAVSRPLVGRFLNTSQPKTTYDLDKESPILVLPLSLSIFLFSPPLVHPQRASGSLCIYLHR